MVLNNIVIIVGGLFLAFSKYANSYQMIIVGRFITGLSCGKPNFIFSFKSKYIGFT